MPKISVLIPVYNVEKYLVECLDSIVGQSERDIEIICVEDGSTDESLAILKKYQKHDHRIQIIEHEENQGLCKSRKDGVAAASAEYIMFVDSDDYIETNACKELYDKIKTADVDVLQFDTELLYESNVSESMAQWVADFMRPTETRIEKNELLSACFIDRKLNCNLVNKIWSAKCCKRAYSYIDDGHYVSAEDRYATFLLLYFADSYNGTLKKYYHYRLGIGVTGGEVLDLARFEKRCQGVLVSQKVEQFLETQQCSSMYEKEFGAFASDILWDCVDCWYNKLERTDCQEGFQILLKYWNPGVVLGALGRRYFENQQELMGRIAGNENCTVALYYRYVGYSEMDDIIRKYLDDYKKQGKNVYLMTDMDAPEQGKQYMDIELIHVASATTANWDQYRVRSEQMYQILVKNNISEVCYLSPTSHVATLDKILIESMNVSFHNAMDEYCLDYYRKEMEKERDMMRQQIIRLEEIERKAEPILNAWWYKMILRAKRIYHRYTDKRRDYTDDNS